MNRNAFFGFLMLIGVIGELFGRVYAGPYYFSLIFWYLGMFIQGVLSIFRIHVPTFFTFSQFLSIVTVIWLIAAIGLLLDGLAAKDAESNNA